MNGGEPDFVDANGNGVLDEGELIEPSVESDYDGFAVFPSLAAFDRDQNGFIDVTEGQVVARGGVDASTGQSLPVPLVAPANYPTASPLSTLVAAVQEASGQPIEFVEQTVSTALGMPSEAYLRANLILLASRGDAVAAESFSRGAQLYATATQIAMFVSGLEGGVAADLAGRLVFRDMAEKLSEPGGLLDLAEPVVVESLLRGTILRAGAVAPGEENVSAAVDVIVAVNQQLDDLPVAGGRDYLEGVARIQVVGNVEASAALRDLSAGLVTAASVRSSYLGSSLDQRIAASEIGNVVMPYIVAEDARIVEGNDGTSYLTMNVILTDASNLPVSVSYRTQDFTANAGEDYTAVSGQLFWPAGGTTVQSLQIPIQGDSEFEPDELFHLLLTDAVNATVLQTVSVAAIANDDAATFSAPSATEGTAYRVEADGSGITLFEGGDVLFDGTLVETDVFTIRGSAGLSNEYRIRVGLDAVAPQNGLPIIGAGADDIMIIDPSLAESIAHVVTGPGEGRFVVNGILITYENVGTIESLASPVLMGIPETPPRYGDTVSLSASVPGFEADLAVDRSWTVYLDGTPIAVGSGESTTVDANAAGVFRVEFVATQPGRLPASASYEFEVVNSPPVAANDSYSTSEDLVLTSAATEGLLANDLDPEDSGLTLTAVNGTELPSADGHALLTLESGARLTVGPDGSFTYDPRLIFDYLAAGERATDFFTYEVADETGLTSTAIVEITINGVNDAPSIAVDSTSAIAEESAVAENGGSFGDLDASDTHTLSASVGTVVDNGDGTWNWQWKTSDGPDESQTVTITATDSYGAATQATFDLAVHNVAPTAHDATFEVVENSASGTAIGSVVATDPGADTLTYAITSGNALGAFAIDSATGAITVADAAKLDFETNPAFELTVAVADDEGATDHATVVIKLLNQASITGVVFVDANQNGLFDANEMGIAGVTVELLDANGTMIASTVTDGGYYQFEDQAPGSYQIRELQPSGVDDGPEALGSIGGTIVANDLMQLSLARTDASDYEFAEFGQLLTSGDTAGIGFWQNKHGQELIAEGGTALAEWLTANFGNVLGNELVGATGADVAAFYSQQLFKQTGKKSAGPARVDAQFMAVAFATFFTSQTLAGNVAASYGFQVTDTGIGTKVVNVGTSGAAFGVADHSNLTVMQLLLATNELTDLLDQQSGFATSYDLNGDGVIDSLEALLRTMAHHVYSQMNETSDL